MNENLLLNLAIVLISFIVSLGLTLWLRGYLTQQQMLDQPNERSSHSIPVPRGGGWALVMVLIPGMILTGIFQGSFVVHNAIVAATVLLVLVSWLDDKKGAHAMMRLSMHLLAASIGSLSFSVSQNLFGDLLPFWLDRLIMIVGWAWFINLYNFMDGIDGITCSETIMLAAGAGVISLATNSHDPFLSILTLMMVGACLGFLVFNWHPAKIFLGDVGSVPLGFITGYVLLWLAVNDHLIAALILPLYYLADSGITIVKRALRGEKVWQAHRQHFYQKAVKAIGRHDIVVYWIIAANLGLIIAALTSIANPWMGLTLAFVIVAILLTRMHKASVTNG